ncbi:MAG: fasciclin domain-containing protein [Caldilineaceae bacterium]|nr:fasciclin domain-containing protein [Caldilineaceae bacterium]
MQKSWIFPLQVGLLLTLFVSSACTLQVRPDSAVTSQNPAIATVNGDLPDTSAMSIADIFKSVDRFSYLAEAAETAGFDLAFTENGPLTVFAPDNAAFEAVPAATREAILADPVQLAAILQYHIVVDRMDSMALTRLDVLQTAAGEPLTVTIGVDGGLFVDGAQLVYRDLPAANGVIHVINQILIPPTLDLALPAAPPEMLAFQTKQADETLEELKAADTSQETVVEVINSITGLQTAATAINAAGMTDALQQVGPFTLFVPTDPAFREVPTEQIQALLNDRAALAERLRYHLILGDVNSADLATRSTLVTASGEELVVTVQEDGQIFVNGAPVYQADIEAANGVIHVIGDVLTPPSAAPTTDVDG